MWLREVLPLAWERLAGGFGAFGGGQTAGLNAIKKDGWGMWLREVLPLAWERPARRFGAFGGGQAAGLNALHKNRWLGHVAARGVGSCLGKACGRVWSIREQANGRLERPSKQMAGACGCERCCHLPGKGLREGLERSGAGKRQARTPFKTDGWGMWLREPLPVALACRVGMPLLPWQATKEPRSTPPVVPGAAPASAKAGVGGHTVVNCQAASSFELNGCLMVKAFSKW